MRACHLVASAVVLGSCTSAPLPTVLPRQVGDRPARDPEHALEVAHDAPVPRASDAKERLLVVRAGSIWWMRPDGTEASQLTVRSLDAPDHRPALSPSGDLVAYASSERGTYRIFLLSPTELIPHSVTDGSGGGDDAPAWSPDGRTLVFLRGDPRDHRDLYAIALDDVLAAITAGESPSLPEPRLLLTGDDDDPEKVGSPVFEPLGTSILFSADRRAGNGTGLWRLVLPERRLERVTAVRSSAPYLDDLEPAISSDGSRIVFASNRHAASRANAEDFDIYTIAPDGSGLTRLTDDPGSAREPSLSPDGQRIFFSSSRDQAAGFESEVYVMAAGGGVQRRMTQDAQPQNRAPFAGRVR